MLGHALSMKTIHGGKAKHDTIDSQQIATLRRGGMLPKAYGYPAEMRATRELLRRRMHLMRQRAERFSHVHTTKSPYNLPEIGANLAYKAHRGGVAARFADAAGPKNIAVDLARITDDDELLRDLELSIIQTAKQHDANTLYRLPTVPGIGSSSAACGSTTSMTWPAAHGYRTASPSVAWSRVRKNPLASAWAPRARTSATSIARGPFLKPPLCACGTIPQAKRPWSAYRQSMRKAKRSPSWRISWRGPPLICSSAKRPVIWTCSSVPQRAARVSLRSHGTPRGMSLHRACSPSCLTASWNAKVCT